jgi:hypothetical protein
LLKRGYAFGLPPLPFPFPSQRGHPSTAFGCGLEPRWDNSGLTARAAAQGLAHRLKASAQVDLKRRRLPNRSPMQRSGPKTENPEKSILRPDLARTMPTPHPAIPGALKSSKAPPVIFQEGRFCRDVSRNAGVFSKNAGAIIGHQPLITYLISSWGRPASGQSMW